MPDKAARFQIRTVYEELAEPVEGELRREPVADADVPCPRCGGREWLLIERRAEPHHPFTRWRALACAKCGAADGWTSAWRARPGRTDDWDEDQVGGMPEQPTVADVCRLAPFRIFAPSPSPRLHSCSYTAGRLTGVTVGERGVEVTTEIRAPAIELRPEDRARQRLRHLIADSDAVLRERRSEPAQELHLAAAHREAEARAAAARAREAIVDVDGAAVPFALVQHERSWVAVADIGDESITIAARRRAPGKLALRALLCD